MKTTQPPPFYSREVEEILTRKPSWLIRNGMMLLVLLVGLLLAGAALIPYQEQQYVAITPGNQVDPESGIPLWKGTLSPETVNRVKLYDRVTLQWHPGEEVKAMEGRVYAIGLSADSTAVIVWLVPDSLPPPLQTAGTAIIHTRKTSLLRTMLNPVISLYTHD